MPTLTQTSKAAQTNSSSAPYTGPLHEQKLVIVGDGGCGKTSLLMVYTRGSFPEDYVPTVFENYTAELTLEKRRVELALWDTAGQEDYDRLRPLSYPDTDVIVLCFAVDNRKSFDNIQDKWAAEVAHFCGPNIPKILVAMKADLRAQENPADGLVSKEEGQQLARKIGAIRYIECSAKYNENVESVFHEAVRGVWEAEKKHGSSNGGKRRLFKSSRCTIC
jgi:Ras family protein A